MTNVDHDDSCMKTNKDHDGASLYFESCQIPTLMEWHTMSCKKQLVNLNKDCLKEVAIGSY
jgi:hypothetical protein